MTAPSTAAEALSQSARPLVGAVARALDTLPADESPLLLALSGGGDSMALLRLLLLAGVPAQRIAAVTVDHGLRPDSADEAAQTARWCALLRVRHKTLVWESPSSTGIQENARKARYALLSQEARRIGARVLLTAHTGEDVAETVMMRLARGSGLSGLARNAGPTTDHPLTEQGLAVLRPLIETRREDLRAFLREVGQDWLEDPSNENARFERVRWRKVLAALAPMGLGTDALERTAARLARADAALESLVAEIRDAVRCTPEGLLRLERNRFQEAPEEIRLRLLARLAAEAGGVPAYGVGAACERAHAALSESGAASLGQAVLKLDDQDLTAWRALRDLPDPKPAHTPIPAWDGRFDLPAMPAHPGALWYPVEDARWPALKAALEAAGRSVPAGAARQAALSLPVLLDPEGQVLACPPLDFP